MTLLEQLFYTPVIANKENLLSTPRHIVVCGMGGSHLAAGLLGMVFPTLPISIHYTYGMPRNQGFDPGDILYVASSYSGNTEETLDAARSIYEEGGHLAVVTSGGKLLSFAEEHSLAYIRIPDNGLQPRDALGYSLVSLAALFGLAPESANIFSEVAKKCADWKGGEKEREMVRLIDGRAGLIYTSTEDAPLGYVWKVLLNETAKIPAFSNVIPELNHNEMEALVSTKLNGLVRDSFHIIFLTQADHDPRLKRRFELTKELYESSRYAVTEVILEGADILEKIIRSLMEVQYVAHELARQYGVDPEAVSVIEDFKKKLTE